MSTGTEPITSPDERSEPCPGCGVDLPSDVRYCEHCGAARTETSPHLEVLVDEAWFRRHDATGLALPTDRPVARVELGAEGVTIGRRRAGEPVPDVDLSGPLGDPAVSHRHARIEPDGKGGWQLVDTGSTNGTVVDGWGPVVGQEAVALGDGSRIHVGAWTTIVLHAP